MFQKRSVLRIWAFYNILPIYFNGYNLYKGRQNTGTVLHDPEMCKLQRNSRAL